MDFQEFPKALYKGDECAVVDDADAENAARADGFVFAGESPAVVESTSGPKEITADELRAQLDAAGIAYDKRWGVAKLAEALKGAA